MSKGKYYRLAKREFEKLGYKVYDELIDSSDFGVPQKRERLFMIGIKNVTGNSFVIPKPSHGDKSRNGKPKGPLMEVIDSLIPPEPKYYFSKRAVEGVKKAKPNMKRALAQDLDGQCLSISSHLAKVSLNSRDPVLLVDTEKELFRRFTPREAAKIQSFPASFEFDGSEGDAYRRIGDAVPPVVMWHIAKAIVCQIF